MWKNQQKAPQTNRRLAFRIYEQANLFYQKLSDGTPNPPTLRTHPQSASSERGKTPLEPDFPDSRSQENATMKVNISNSGIAFTCSEFLQAGDYLLLRVLLLPNMTEIVSSCRVVYCRPGNPFETDRYPFKVGAVFVNLTAADSDLLDRHIERRKKQQWIIQSSLALLILSVLAAPELAWELVTELGHYLLELLLHLLHLGFEYLEMQLDHLVEHFFHTEMRETQIIVFYILFGVSLPILYFMGRRLQRASLRSYQTFVSYCWRKHASFLFYWGERSLAEKVSLISLSTLAVAGYCYLAV